MKWILLRLDSNLSKSFFETNQNGLLCGFTDINNPIRQNISPEIILYLADDSVFSYKQKR